MVAFCVIESSMWPKWNQGEIKGQMVILKVRTWGCLSVRQKETSKKDPCKFKWKFKTVS